ncbi:MAG: electron transport complex subunit RsxC [Calditerrivibrio sp.]|nr:electron transport complex subunit RsxC [Calditerrivibrio sp.]MCA1932260.1 electron transport complex subunit RsxC [Calditerrivibrio sp.]
MQRYSFVGGIHPDYSKEKTSSKKIEILSYEVGEVLTIPISQHLGAPSKELVKKKDIVNVGQKIASAGGAVSSNLHSPFNGEIEGISLAPHPIMGNIPSIKLRITDLNNEYKKIETKEKFQDTVAEAGIVGLGGATFPTHIKLSPPKKVEYLIINGAECEPFLTCDHRLMVEYTEEIILGAILIKEKLNINNLIVGIEDNKPDAIKSFEALKGKYLFELQILHTKYPQGGEKQLIYSTIGRTVPEGKLPLDVGVIVHNVGTCKAIYEAFTFGKPLYERVVTVTGAVKEPKNILVKIGTPISKLIDYCGGTVGDVKKIIIGGPMMGFAATSLDTPVTKGTSGVIVLRDEDLYDGKKSNCIRCGRCIEACPMGLVPAIMEQFSIQEMYEKLIDWHVVNCIECGCCSYVCPSRRPLVGYFKTAKRQVINILRQRAQK